MYLQGDVRDPCELNSLLESEEPGLVTKYRVRGLIAERAKLPNRLCQYFSYSIDLRICVRPSNSDSTAGELISWKIFIRSRDNLSGFRDVPMLFRIFSPLSVRIYYDVYTVSFLVLYEPSSHKQTVAKMSAERGSLGEKIRGNTQQSGMVWNDTKRGATVFFLGDEAKTKEERKLVQKIGR